jgi:glyceraldehyde 3-phosphate dehydrogenase
MTAPRTLGINGLGRIGKLTLWYHLAHDDFDTFVINVGRPVGTSLQSVLEYLGKDSTYGALHRWLGGCSGIPELQVIDEEKGLARVHGKDLVVLRQARDPKDIPWRDYGVTLAVDCTGKFRDPHTDPQDGKAALRGHLAAGCRAVLISSPFKSAVKGVPLPDDSAVLIHGINHQEFDPSKHKIVSAASCTTTALAHMMRPLLARDLTRNMITAGMSTVHAVTNSQPLLDAVPGSNATDLRKTRSGMNNIVITSTNAAKALEQVMPEIAQIGFMADSVRIPTASVSLIVLNVTFQAEERLDGTVDIDREAINSIYQDAADGEARGLLKFSMEQNVSADMLGEDAACVIEGVETHTRTGFVDVRINGQLHRIPVTHVKVFGWYDNEMGSYTYRLGELTAHVAKSL